jgi:alcohol dehydrogenase
MKQSVFHKPGDIRYDIMPGPNIGLATDVIPKLISTAICT